MYNSKYVHSWIWWRSFISFFTTIAVITITIKTNKKSSTKKRSDCNQPICDMEAGNRPTLAKCVRNTLGVAAFQTKLLDHVMHNNHHYPQTPPTHLASANTSPGFSVNEILTTNRWKYKQFFQQIKSEFLPPSHMWSMLFSIKIVSNKMMKYFKPQLN